MEDISCQEPHTGLCQASMHALHSQHGRGLREYGHHNLGQEFLQLGERFNQIDLVLGRLVDAPGQGAQHRRRQRAAAFSVQARLPIDAPVINLRVEEVLQQLLCQHGVARQQLIDQMPGFEHVLTVPQMVVIGAIRSQGEALVGEPGVDE